MARPKDEALAADGMTDGTLIVDVDGFEGPLDLLLALARTQKVDLSKISVLDLARQYLSFVERADRLRLELAADYVVMAAWLAYLKSRLLLPPDPEAEGPSGDALAARLAFQLERLEAMRGAADALMARDRRGRDVFARGMPEARGGAKRVTYAATVLDLMRGYARVRTRDAFRPFAMDRPDVLPLDAAMDRLRPLVDEATAWTDLAAFAPSGWDGTTARRRAATVAIFAAALELARDGVIDLRQEGRFGPIALRRRA